MHSDNRRGFIVETCKYFCATVLASAIGSLGLAQKVADTKRKKPIKIDHIESKIRKLIADQLSIDPRKVTTNARLVEDLKADSLDKVEVVLAIEEAFSVQIGDADCSGISTLGDAVNYVKSHATPLPHGP